MKKAGFDNACGFENKCQNGGHYDGQYDDQTNSQLNATQFSVAHHYF